MVMSADTWLLATFAVLAVLPFFILPYLLPSHVFCPGILRAPRGFLLVLHTVTHRSLPHAPGYSLSSQNGCSLDQKAPHSATNRPAGDPFGVGPSARDELAEFLNRLDWRKYRLLASKGVSCTTRLALYGQFLRERVRLHSQSNFSFCR